MIASSPSEIDLWQAHVSTLRTALSLRKPDAISAIKEHVRKIDEQISALSLRRELAAGSEAWPLVATLSDRIAALAARMDDLRGLVEHLRSEPLANDTGPTPQAAAKGRELIDGDGECLGQFTNADPGIDDLSSELKRAAMDIYSGYSSITGAAMAAISGRSPSTVTEGKKTKALQMQYWGWVERMHHKRLSTWACDDVICQGLSRADSAKKRRCDPIKVYGELVAGLTLYAETYPPLGDQP